MSKYQKLKAEKLDWLRNIVANPPADDECAIWPFGTLRSGYCHVMFEGKAKPASRVVLILSTGIEPVGMHAAHGPCHNRACLSPLHLEWKTPKQNSHDKFRDGTAIGPYRTDPSLPECSNVDCNYKASTSGMCSTHYRQHLFNVKRSEVLTGLSDEFVTPRKAMQLVIKNGGAPTHHPTFVELLERLEKNGDLQRNGNKYRLAQTA